MHKCSMCKKQTKRGRYNYKGLFTCLDCVVLSEDLHFDTVEINSEGEVKLVSPFSGVSEKDQRQKFIDFVYLLFNNQISPAAFRLMNSYLKKGYTWLGMLRAMEWFYVIKKNDVVKAKKNIGIIPYIYEESNNYYQYKNKQIKEKAQHYYNNTTQVVEETVVHRTNRKKPKEIDISKL